MVSKIMKFWQNKPTGRKRNKKMDAGKNGHFVFQLFNTALDEKSCKTCISTDFCHFAPGGLI